MHYSTLGLSLFLLASPAQAQTAGATCTNYGQETLSSDGTDLVVCLYNSQSDHSLIWKASTGGNSGGGYVTQQTTTAPVYTGDGGTTYGPSSTSASCLTTNPMTSTGSCSCPTGYIAVPNGYSQYSSEQTIAGESGNYEVTDGYEGYTCIQGSPQSGAWAVTSTAGGGCYTSCSADITGTPCGPVNSTSTLMICGGSADCSMLAATGDGAQPATEYTYTCQ
jgi:hypothetical protein